MHHQYMYDKISVRKLSEYVLAAHVSITKFNIFSPTHGVFVYNILLQNAENPRRRFYRQLHYQKNHQTECLRDTFCLVNIFLIFA